MRSELLKEKGGTSVRKKLRPSGCVFLIIAAFFVFYILNTGSAFAAAKAKQAEKETNEGGAAPSVVRTLPEDNDEDVALDVKIMAIFNKKMQDEDINEFTVTLNDGVSDISTTVRYNSELMKVTVSPLENLQPDHGYFLTISRTIRDLNGKTMTSDKVWKFRTVKKVDSNPPVVADVSPTVSASGVPVDTKLEVIFNKKMYEASINENTITVKCGREKIAGAIRYFDDVNKAIFSPLNNLKPNAVHEVKISSEICDASKNKMSRDYVYTFKTGSARIAGTVISADGGAESVKKSAKTSSKIKNPAARGKIAAAVENENAAEEDEPAVSKTSERLSANPKIQKLMAKIKKDKGESGADEDEPVVAEDEIAGDGKAGKFEIIEMFPAPGADMINLDEKIIVKFNKKMNPASFNIFNFSLQDGDEYIFGKVEYNQKTKTAVYTPSGALKVNRKYRVTLSEKIEDIQGNRLGQPNSWEFSTLKQIASANMKKMFDEPKSMSKDITGPNVISVAPRDNSDNVPASSQITASFDEAIKDFSLNSFTFRVLNSEAEVPGKIYYDSAQKKAIFTPRQPLEEGAAYTAVVTKGVMDLSSNYMQREKKWKFLVGKSWSGRGPAIIGLKPDRDGFDIELSPVISVTFDRRMKGSTITPFSFFVTDGTRAVQGRVTYDDATTTASFTPWNTLSPNTLYNVTIAKTVEDKEGMTLSEPQMWKFKTGSGLKTAGMTKGNVTSVAAGEDASMQIKVQKAMGSEAIAPMGEKTAASAEAMSEIGQQMNVNYPKETKLRQIVPIADVKDRLSASDKGAYGKVTAKSVKDTIDNSEIVDDTPPDEMALRHSVSDKGAYGKVNAKRIKDTVDQTDVIDDAAAETLKDQIAKFLSDDSKAQAKMGAAIDALPSNSEPVADAYANGMGNNITPNPDREMMRPEEMTPKIPIAGNEEEKRSPAAEKIRQDVATKFNGQNVKYTREDGIMQAQEYRNPKSVFVQMSEPPSKENSINSDNPVETMQKPQQPKLIGDDADLINLEKVEQYGSEDKKIQDGDNSQPDQLKNTPMQYKKPISMNGGRIDGRPQAAQVSAAVQPAGLYAGNNSIDSLIESPLKDDIAVQAGNAYQAKTDANIAAVQVQPGIKAPYLSENPAGPILKQDLVNVPASGQNIVLAGTGNNDSGNFVKPVAANNDQPQVQSVSAAPQAGEYEAFGPDAQAENAALKNMVARAVPDNVATASDASPAAFVKPASGLANGNMVAAASETNPASGPKGTINGMAVDEIMADNSDNPIIQAQKEGLIKNNRNEVITPENMQKARKQKELTTFNTFEPQLSTSYGNEQSASQFYITAIYPNKNSEKIKLNSTITVVFSQDADVATLNGVNFIVTGAEGTVNGKILYNQRMKKLIFRPAQPLNYGTRYEVTLNAGIKNTTGQSLMPLKWQFKTE